MPAANFGVLAAYLANCRAGPLALVAMVMSVVGNCLILAIFGFSTIVSPVIGRLYLEGQQGVMEVNDAIFGSALVPLVSGPGLLLYLVGNILLGVAVWRSGTLPKLAGALYAPTGLAMPLPTSIARSFHSQIGNTRPLPPHHFSLA